MRVRIINYNIARMDVHCSIVKGTQLYIDEVYRIPIDWLLCYNSRWRCMST